MSLKVGRVDEYLGQPISDPYGRKLGYIIGFYSNPDGNITSFEVSIGDNEFRELPVDRFKFEGNSIVVLPEWEYNAVVLERRIETLKRRIAALEELNSRKEIPSHAYESFKKRLEESLIALSNESKNIKEMLVKRIHEIEDQIVELEKAITAVKMSYISGEINEKSYKLAMEHLRRNMDILVKEKESVKKHLDKIESLEALPASTLVPQPVTESKENPQPIPVVVVES